jgi:hypothetical protein
MSAVHPINSRFIPETSAVVVRPRPIADNTLQPLWSFHPHGARTREGAFPSGDAPKSQLYTSNYFTRMLLHHSFLPGYY